MSNNRVINHTLRADSLCGSCTLYELYFKMKVEGRYNPHCAPMRHLSLALIQVSNVQNIKVLCSKLLHWSTRTHTEATFLYLTDEKHMAIFFLTKGLTHWQFCQPRCKHYCRVRIIINFVYPS